MALPTSGPLRLSQVLTEFATNPRPMMLSELYRGGSIVRANAANNPSTNLAANVPTSDGLRVSDFYGAGRGFHFYNNGVLTNYLMSSAFGDDWLANYPKTFENGPQGVIGATSTSYRALTIPAGAGKITFLNYGEVQGAGGAANSGAGQTALYIAQGCDVYNHGAIRGGGGGGGAGGRGGQGGWGYVRTQQDGGWIQNSYEWMWTRSPDVWRIYWAGNLIFDGKYSQSNNGTIQTYSPGDGWTYFPHSWNSSGTRAAIARYYDTNYAGGAGGAGGPGGRGQGFNHPRAEGSPGAGGQPGGPNAGYGGAGGHGNWGGWWGEPGYRGLDGLTGHAGNLTGGYAGSPGQNGGPAGYSIHAVVPYNLYVVGTLNGVRVG